MRQAMKKILLVSAVVFGLLYSAWAYSLGGPVGNNPKPIPSNALGDSWQAPVIGYGLPGDENAPKNLGEEYRRNTPVMYYAEDASFLDFFGSNGVVAVDGAFTIMNNLTNVSSYSASLSEFPLESRHINFQAQALGLFDLKSFTLGALMEQIGLADPVRYVWTLHDRFHVTPGPACPANMEYLVVQRNFDFVSSPLNQLQYSPYINDTLYSYQIIEFCTGPNPLALAEPFSVDPLADIDSPVASFAIGYGDFYTSLTRDDVAGLRYLLETNNINFETATPGALLETTNFGSTNIIQNLDLGVLLTAAFTNDPTTLVTLFPNLVITSVTTNFQTICTPNVVSTIKNNTGSPIGSPPIFVVTTNGFNCVFQPTYIYTFGNVITNSFSTTTVATNMTISFGQRIGAPFGSPLTTNTTITTITLTNPPSGSYFLVPPGDCGLIIVQTNSGNNGVIRTTNVLTTATNANGFVDSQSIITSFTNRQFLAQPVICGTVAASTGLYPGIENMKFVKSSFDSLLGQFFQPITNNYTMVFVTNSQAMLQHFQRVVTTPDFTFSAADLVPGPGVIPSVPTFQRNLNFDQANVLPGLAGPGVITPSTTITFNKVGPVFFNETVLDNVLDGTPYFTETPGGDVSDLFYLAYFVWASYDGTTNAPVVYPDGASIDNLGNMILVQISPPPPVLSNGTKGISYPTTTFTATGGAFSPPFTWSAPGGLPPGLSIVSNPDNTATLSGTPTQSGTFDFILQLTDSLSRSVQWNYSIIIQ
ncbi:MAG TPA: hypothetical protein VHY30_08730 [Verrucomicrobiae bacterium]|jgi:hypothetical protein|nr:hypothetical protein [Verrucomicrobiae bacterium]